MGLLDIFKKTEETESKEQILTEHGVTGTEILS
jgi:hypothetical protein